MSKGADNKILNIIQYDDLILFKPVLPEIAECLSYTEKSLECSSRTGWVQSVVRNDVDMYMVDEYERGVTYPGFLSTIVDCAVANGIEFTIDDKRKAVSGRGTFPMPRKDLISGTRFSQRRLIEEAVDKDMSGLIGAPTRYGKCLGKDTKVLTASYDIVKVQDIKVGDELMGPDGTQRKVVALGRGREMSYRVIPNKGEPFICNESHILSLKMMASAADGSWAKGDVVNIRMDDYLKSSQEFKNAARLWYSAIKFEETELPVAPREAGTIIGLYIRTFGTTGREYWPKKFAAEVAPFLDNGECVIPKVYLTASSKQRLELLAGIMDGAGMTGRRKICPVSERLAEDIIRLCRGLGLGAEMDTYMFVDEPSGERRVACYVRVYGDIQCVPCKHTDTRPDWMLYSPNSTISPLTAGFAVEPVGEQDYYGVVLEGPDKLFLLWDHLVTHNTSMMVNFCNMFPDTKICVTAPGVDLVRQLHGDFTGEWGVKGNRDVRLICSGAGRSETRKDNGITICSADSLGKVNAESYGLLLADEPHALVTDNRLAGVNAFKGRRIGFGATLSGRFDGRDKLITGLFGPVLSEVTYLDAVEEGAICPLVVIFYNVELSPGNYRDRNSAYDAKLFNNKAMAELTAQICDEVIPLSWQTLVFIKHEMQAETYMRAMGEDTTVAMAKRMSASERKEITEKLRNNIVTRCLCTKIYVQGVTFPDVRVLINAEAGGNNTSAIQKPGRLAQCRPGKKCGVVIDFAFTPPYGESLGDYYGEPWTQLCYDSRNRRQAYEDKGYEIYDVETMEELKDVFDDIAK